ncbi:nose resistant to fluoxetine protein 6-like [Epargyreus clarus]|uniref:nose resistant to fluoxetine protein 6-like n=1 Tax=Epargyreus clarus TaxID=520877 RepID=UPI003C2D0998
MIINVNALMNLDIDSDRFPFDRQLYEDVLDPDLCRQQLSYLAANDTTLLARFLDAGIRVPRSILMGNVIDLGNFHQCLAINEKVEDMAISGKYCRIRVPVNQELRLPDFLERKSWKFDPNELYVDEKTLKLLEKSNVQKMALTSELPGVDIERLGPDSPLSNVQFSLAVCIPRPCTTEQAINGLLFNFTKIGFNYTDISCRLPDDRPWVAADYVAIVVFSLLGVITLISSCYDIYQSIYLKKASKEISSLYTSFSVYTNTRRLLTFNSSPGSLECLDGIRALAMIWVILGHSFFTLSETLNPIEGFEWSISLGAAWITVAPLTVDTFFFLSGLLLVYTTVGKMNRMQLIKNVHVFYLFRLLRMFPILAAVILFESSLYMRVSDGPLWNRVAMQSFRCREFWWSTLLHLQNIVNPRNACIGVTWYLAIDIQLHILSPIILFWVLSSKRAAWTALNTSLVATLTAATVYCFVRNFPSGIISPNRRNDPVDFYTYYYVNILTRASPFLVGMVYGYLLHLWRKKEADIPKFLTRIILLCSLAMLLVAMYCAQIAMRLDWDNQLADNFFNSFLRPMWALALGWVIFACMQGSAEPINWFLSLRMWKLPARISYAMYLVHYSIMVVFYATIVAPIHFSVPAILFNFMSFLLTTMVLSFFVTILIDSPFSTIFKLLLGNFKKTKTPKIVVEDDKNPNMSIKGITNNGFTEDETKKLQYNLKPETGDMKLNINASDNTFLIEQESKKK